MTAANADRAWTGPWSLSPLGWWIRPYRFTVFGRTHDTWWWGPKVRWKPFCGNPDCSCTTNTSKPCAEWQNGEHEEGRCAVCGWPEWIHDSGMR